jgi:hypothetical protein
MIIGGNLAFGRKWGGGNNPVGDYCLTNLAPPLVRIGIPLRAYHTDGDTAGVHDHFLAVQKMAQTGAEIIGSIWHIPVEWQEWGKIRSGNVDDVIALLKSWIDQAHTVYGINLKALSFNEPKDGVKVKFTPDALTMFIIQALQAGITVPWLVADTSNPKKAIDYINSVIANPQARNNCVAIAYHTWNMGWAWGDTDVALVRTLAASAGLPIWVTELGLKAKYDPPYPWSTQKYADDVKAMYDRVSNIGNAAAALYWQYSPDDAADFPVLDTNTLTPYPIYNTIKAMGGGTLPPPPLPPDPNKPIKDKLLQIRTLANEIEGLLP